MRRTHPLPWFLPLFVVLIGATGARGDAAPPDLATLQKQFTEQDTARTATTPNSQEREKAAKIAAQTASDIGWLLFEKGDSTAAASWFAKRTSLKKEAYTHATAYWENEIKNAVAQNEKAFATKIADWRKQLKTATDEKKKKDLQDGIGAMIRMQHVMRYNAVTMLQQLARDNDDIPKRVDSTSS